jgi:hypothetical protein
MGGERGRRRPGQTMRNNLEIPPDPWDVPRFRLARFTKPSG